MPQILPAHLKLLLSETENVLRHKVATTAHCEQLAKEIKKATAQVISPQTLRRLFGLIKSKSLPGTFTLDALSQYCGHQDWAGFCMEKETVTSSVNASWVLDFYKAPLPNTPLTPSYDYFVACKNIAERIVADGTLYKTLPPQLASFRNGQALFFECFPYLDGLGNGYAKHLKIYLHHRSDSYEAQVFGNCLLFLGAYLTKNDKGIKHYYNVVDSLKCPQPKQIHENPIARFMGVQILYHQYMGNRDGVMFWRAKMREYIPTDFGGAGFVNYRFVLSEHLFLAGFYEDCIELLSYAKDPFWKKTSLNTHGDSGYYEVVDLIDAVSNLKLGRADVGREMFKSINTSSFFFTKSKLYNLYYWSEQLRLCNKNAQAKRDKILEQINDLVKATGFVYFLPCDN